MIGNIFMWQGLFIGGIAILIGVSFGLLGSIYISDIAAGIESGFGIQLLNADVYPIDFLPSRLKFADVITVVGGVVVLSLIATLYPARRAAAIAPTAALRME
jgi:lipoprotein-releasing system permease protein